MLAIGGRAPEFTLPDQNDQSVSLSTLLRHGPLILYFYPADFTPGCTKRGLLDPRSARRDPAGRARRGRRQSADARDATARSARSTNCPSRCCPMSDKFVIRMYDVLGPLGFGVRRATYLIDQARYIRAAVLADFRIGAAQPSSSAGPWR